MPNKVKISQKEFDDIYEIEEEFIKTGEHTTDDGVKAEPEPEFLTKEEQELDDKFFEEHPIEEEVIEP